MRLDLAIDKINIEYGVVIAVLTAIFGKYWILFVGFLVLNVVDYVSGSVRSWMEKTLSSEVGAIGIIKKVSYWVVIGLAFYVSIALVKIAEIFGFQADFLTLIGWITLASYIVNEARSILENLIQMEVQVPEFLIRGLKIADQRIEEKADKILKEMTDDERYDGTTSDPSEETDQTEGGM